MGANGGVDDLTEPKGGQERVQPRGAPAGWQRQRGPDALKVEDPPSDRRPTWPPGAGKLGDRERLAVHEVMRVRFVAAVADGYRRDNPEQRRDKCGSEGGASMCSTRATSRRERRDVRDG